MKKLLFIFTISALVAINSAIASIQYDPSQLSTFEKTGICQNCDLSNAMIVMQYKGAVHLQKANLTKTDFGDPHSWQNSDFTDIVASSAVFANGDFSGTNFSNALLLDASFQGADLSRTNFTNANVKQVNFADANLSQSNITATQLADAYSVCNAILPDGSKGGCK